jgi:hypothetical protein
LSSSLLAEAIIFVFDSCEVSYSALAKEVRYYPAAMFRSEELVEGVPQFVDIYILEAEMFGELGIYQLSFLFKWPHKLSR